MPAEWEAQGAVLIAWPHAHTDWAYMLDDITECYVNIIKAIVPRAKVLIVGPDLSEAKLRLHHLPQSQLIFVDVNTNDTWARDYGPITVVDGDSHVLLDFQFNGWGLKFASCYDNLVTMALYKRNAIRGLYENHRGFVFEGGSIESDGEGTLLTTAECLLSPNRNAEMTESQIESYLKDVLGATRVLWLHHGALAGDDTDSHIDTLARLAPNHTIVYTATNRTDDEHYAELQTMKSEIASFTTASGKAYNLVELPLPEAIYDENGDRLPATYANYLVLNGALLMPTYEQPKYDSVAAAELRKAFPDYEIIPVDCRALIRQHGSLHCATMQLPIEIIRE
jgi:agmatine/peptidylarginine deiminase